LVDEKSGLGSAGEKLEQYFNQRKKQAAAKLRTIK
jgi:hypothetical protein